MRKFVFVDTETTGLDSSSDSLVELSYATLDSEIKTLYFGVTEVPDFIDSLTKFYERGVDKQPEATMEQIDEFRNLLEDSTMVAANPSFDKGFLEEEQLWTAHYRMLDIESYAMARLGLEYVPSMIDIVDRLRAMGYSLTEPDHSSYNDVMAMREAYKIMRYM